MREFKAVECGHTPACYQDGVGRAARKLEPKTGKHRLVACAKCRAPVASSAWSGTVLLACKKCGHEDTRAMNLREPSAGDAAVAYRDSAKPRRIEGEPAVADLVVNPKGRSATSLEYDAVIDLLRRQPAADEDFASFEWERVWSAATFAFLRAASGMDLEARVILESALEVVHTPAYRALILARLAQHSASIGAPGVAKKWLKARPETSIPTIDSEVRAARAMIAYVKGEHDDVVRMTGDRKAGDGFSGAATMLAIALNIDSNARSGRQRLADDMVRDCIKQGYTDALLGTMCGFHVSIAVLERAVNRVRKRNASISAAVAAAVFVYAFVVYEFPIGRTAPAALVAVVSSIAVSWWGGVWSLAGSKPVRVGKKIVEWVASMACVALPLYWLTQTSPPPSPPAVDVSPSDWSPDP